MESRLFTKAENGKSTGTSFWATQSTKNFQECLQTLFGRFTMCFQCSGVPGWSKTSKNWSHNSLPFTPVIKAEIGKSTGTSFWATQSTQNFQECLQTLFGRFEMRFQCSGVPGWSKTSKKWSHLIILSSSCSCVRPSVRPSARFRLWS